MLSLANVPQDQLRRAVERAIDYNPIVVPMGDNVFVVQAQSDPHKSYTVTVNGTQFTCDCPAHTRAGKPGDPMLCKHVAAVAIEICQNYETGYAVDRTLVYDVRLDSNSSFDAYYRLYSDGSEVVNIWQYGDPAEGRNITLDEAEYYIFPTVIAEARQAYQEWQWRRELDAKIDEADATQPTATQVAGYTAEEFEEWVENWFSR